MHILLIYCFWLNNILRIARVSAIFLKIFFGLHHLFSRASVLLRPDLVLNNFSYRYLRDLDVMWPVNIHNTATVFSTKVCTYNELVENKHKMNAFGYLFTRKATALEAIQINLYMKFVVALT